MNGITSAMITVFRALLADGEIERVGELMKALEGRPESEIEPLWDFYTGHWVSWFLDKYEEQLTRARHPLNLVAIDRPGGYCVELYESRRTPSQKLNTVAQIRVHSDAAAVRLQTALHARLEKMAPSPYIVPIPVTEEEYMFQCSECGGQFHPWDSDPTFLHCDGCGNELSQYELMVRGAHAYDPPQNR
jgi:hypothetical protein